MKSQRKRDYLNAYASQNYENVVLRIRRDGRGNGVMDGVTRESIKAAAAKAGMPMSEFLLSRACEAMAQRGEIFPSKGEGKISHNEMLTLRGEAAKGVLETARELGEDPRELVMQAVRYRATLLSI